MSSVVTKSDGDRLLRRRTRLWNEFQAWVNAHSDSRWVFRGLGDKAFALTPSVGRRAKYSLADERTILEIFRKRVAEFNAAEIRTIDVNINYVVRGTKDERTLVYPFYLIEETPAVLAAG